MQLVDTYGLTNVGKVRKINEDHYFIGLMEKKMMFGQTSLSSEISKQLLRSSRAHLFLVADGLGGQPDGQLASEAAVEIIARYVTMSSNWYYDLNVEQEIDFLGRLEKSVFECHEELLQKFDGGNGAPSSTLTLVVLLWPRAYVVHVGDSRCYYFRQDELKQLTEDQTLAQQMMAQGVVSEERLKTSRYHHILTSALGSSVEPKIGLVDLERGDTLVLCTDGLTNHVSNEEIQEEMQKHRTAQESCEYLVDLALERGGTDNVTIIVARMTGEVEDG